MSNTPTLDLELIKDRLNAATPGPWLVESTGVDPSHPLLWSQWVIWNEPGGTGENDLVVAEADSPDAEFIAHARTDIVLLVLEVERLRSEVAELRIEAFRCTCYNDPD